MNLDFFVGHHSYWFVFLLSFIGLFGVVIKRNLFKKLIGLGIFQVSVIIFWLLAATKQFATVPVTDPNISPNDFNLYLNPLPHTLMLTAIVVGVATSGIAMALMIVIYKNYKTLDERDLLKKIK